MLHCEDAAVRAASERIAAYARAHPDAASYYKEIGSLADLSLQNASLARDLEFFGEADRILSVIATIVMHPHILNARETVIVRAEQAHGITPEMFFDTVRDQKLWKEKRGVMAPAEVYYFRNVDDLANYENRFIVHLLDVLASRLAGDARVYDGLVGTLSHALTEEGSPLETLYEKVASLSAKLRRIRATEFYRIVSKANTHFARVEPTNLFKHDRAYGACYKFYLRNMTYASQKARSADLARYFFTRLLIALKRLGYQLKGWDHVLDDAFGMRPMTLENGRFSVSLDRAEGCDGIGVNVMPKGGLPAVREVLLFDATLDFSDSEKQILSLAEGTYGAVGVWDLARLDGSVRPLGMRGADENGLILAYLKDRTRLQKASRKIYEKHCPSCGGRDISVHGMLLRCAACKTEYTFLDETVWFTGLRRP